MGVFAPGHRGAIGVDVRTMGAITVMDGATQQHAARVEETMPRARSLEREANALVGQGLA